MKDDKAIAIVAKETGVRDDSLSNIVEGLLASVHPDPSDWIGVLALSGKLTKRCGPEFKVVDVFTIKLSKADKLCNIAHYLRRRPRLKQLMLGLSRSILFGANIVPNKLKTLGEDEAFLEAQGQTVGYAYLKLTFHVFQRHGQVLAMTDDVVDDIPCIHIIADFNAGETLPLAVNVIDKIDRNCDVLPLSLEDFLN